MLKISLSAVVGDNAKVLAKEFEEIARQKVKVFTTRVRDGDIRYAFMTTSKDTHMHLGRMFKEGLESPASRGMMLLSSKETERGIFITGGKNPTVSEEFIFH